MKYKKNEFCKAIRCPDLVAGSCQHDEFGCVATAKEFHNWLRENGFIIIKPHADCFFNGGRGCGNVRLGGNEK